jgi:hypothetical protein
MLEIKKTGTYLVKIILVPVFLISSIPGEDYSGSSLFDFEHTWIISIMTRTLETLSKRRI